MKFTLLLCSLIHLFPLLALSQNSIVNLEIASNDAGSALIAKMESGETVKLQTRFSEKDIQSIESYGNDKFILVLIKPIESKKDNIINAAFKLKDHWVQDYQDRSYFKPSTSLTDTHIISIEICDEQTLSVVYETITFNNESFKVVSDLVLGKNLMYELETKSSHSFTLYGIESEMSELIKKSPRMNFMNY